MVEHFARSLKFTQTREMDKKKSYRNWLPLPQLPTSSPAVEHTENYRFAGASAPPTSLMEEPSTDFDYENDFDGGVFSEAENLPAVIHRRDAERQKNLPSDLDYENGYDGGDVVTSLLSETGQASSAAKQRRDVENQNDLSSDFDYENDYDDGDMTSELSGSRQGPSAIKQREDTEKENDLASDFDYENDYDNGSVMIPVLSKTGSEPLAVKQRREKEKQKGIYMFAGASASPEADSPNNLDDNDYDDGGVSGTEEVPSDVRQRRYKEKQTDAESTKRKGCGEKLSIGILYCLIVICFVLWSAQLCLFLVKISALSEELKALNLNQSEMLITVKKDLGYMKKDLDYVQATQKIIERTVSNNISELQDITASICVRVDVSSSQSCPHQWKFHGKNCYYFSTEKKNWTNALWNCIQNKSFLVSIWSDTEQGFLKDSINNTETYWLGLTDVERSGHWKWKEGDLFATTAFWNLGSSMKESNQHCGIMHPNGTWGPAMCSLPYQWICKKKVIC